MKQPDFHLPQRPARSAAATADKSPHRFAASLTSAAATPADWAKASSTSFSCNPIRRLPVMILSRYFRVPGATSRRHRSSAFCFSAVRRIPARSSKRLAASRRVGCSRPGLLYISSAIVSAESPTSRWQIRSRSRSSGNTAVTASLSRAYPTDSPRLPVRASGTAEKNRTTTGKSSSESPRRYSAASSILRFLPD